MRETPPEPKSYFILKFNGQGVKDLQLSFKENKSTLIVKVAGELDLKTAEEFKCSVDQRLKISPPVNLLFNFNRLEFIDSSGLGVILGRYRKLKKEGGELAVCGLSRTIYRIFELSGVFKILPAYRTEDEALSNFNKEVGL